MNFYAARTNQRRCVMSERESREEILDLLSRGKISIDEAVSMLDQSTLEKRSPEEDEPLYRAEMDQGFEGDEIVKIKLEEESVEKGQAEVNESIPEPKHNGNGKRPRWLRVQVVNTKTGKNKVTVNIPFGMVRFGLGLASVFSPEMKGVDLDDVREMFDNAEAGLLVDVQDDESNEHVRVFFE